MKRMLYGVLMSGGVLVLVAAAAAARAQDSPHGFVETVRRTTAPYADVEAARAAGFAQFMDCVSEPGRGAMGIHFLNMDLVGDGRLDVNRPEALMYAPMPDGRLELLGVEYIVFQDAWDAAHPQPPVLLGQEFHLVRSPNRYGVPAFYQLHVWSWRENPMGPFNSWNPRVSCPDGGAVHSAPDHHH
jgi:hypothetical protein